MDRKNVAQGKGFGKTILFGEHFVVYGLPAIASAIGDRTIASVEPGQEFEFTDKRPATEGYKEKKADEINRQLDALLEHFSIPKDGDSVRITLEGNLFCTSGVGASAALAASISRALNELKGIGMNDDGINKAAYIAEEAGSGTPSGIDNTCSVFGGLLWFVKNLEGGTNTMERLKAKEPVEIVLGNTGITQETKVVVGDVAKKREENQEEFGKIFSDYKETVNAARPALEGGDWETVGGLMDKNQDLLRKIGVSCDEIEQIVKIARDNGAAGAKLTGTGRGGYVLMLTPGKELQEKVASAVEGAGFKVLKTTIG
jgi:mevalonate kinase